MNSFRIFILSLFFIGLIACNKEQKKEVSKKEITPIVGKKVVVENKIKQKEVIKKDWDSIKPDTVVPFLIAFGKANPETIVLIKTKYGNIKLRLYKDTPLHRANFIFLAKAGYFDTTIFYRVLEDFVIQGGNSENIEMMKFRRKYKNYRLPSEFRSNRTHKFGALASARKWQNNPNKNSNPFEFYIVQKKDGAHHLDNEHTVFGEVISGYSTINKIAKLETSTDEWPYEDVYMKVEVLN
ncbi:MAG: peptidylprolyl isomerase [Flavobacteriaceae bacterium]|nr:MAG: peptidylprolyl isomerase [Flavobacteriaceae bacterium]